MHKGQLIKWKDERGFGFIQSENQSQEVFLHISELKDLTRRPQVGDTIYYHLIVKKGKIRAGNAFILGARSKPSSSSKSLIERRQKAECRRQKDQLQGDSNPPATVDHQIEDFGGGFEPKSKKDEGRFEPSALCPKTSALQGGSLGKKVNKYPFPYWEALVLSILPLAGSLHFAWITGNPIPIILYTVMSLVTFFLYAEDKSRAKRGQWRISERTLHLCEFAGGWLGGFVAQRKLRHKSIKSSYQIVFWTIVVIHIAFWIDWLFLGGASIEVFFK